MLVEGSGTLVVEKERFTLEQGEAIFVPAGARHRFEDYEVLKLLVIFRR